MIAGLILSGGASTRMGVPKALLYWRGETFLERLFRVARLHCGAITIVTGAHDREIRSALPNLAPHIRFNENHAWGQFSSLRLGLEHIERGWDVLYWPVDFGAVAETTVEVVCAGAGAPLTKPVYKGLSGHPILLGKEALETLCSMPIEDSGGYSAKELLKAIPALRVPVEDPACVFDVDTPEDYARLRSELP